MRAIGADDLLQSFWLGWASAVLVLQVWHLALPVDLRATGTLAALEVGSFAHRSWHLANGLLVLVLGARIALAMGRLLRHGRAAQPVDVFWALMAPGAFPIGVGLFLASPSPDVAIFALGTVASG